MLQTKHYCLRQYGFTLALAAAIYSVPIAVDAQSGSRAISPSISTSTTTAGSATRRYGLPNAAFASPFQRSFPRDLRLPVAINGYSIVALRNQQQWVAGLEKYQAVFDGQIYWFADERQRAVFAASPELYAPALGGDCVVTFLETGRRVPGDFQFGVFHQRRLFFFSGRQQLDRFRTSPNDYSLADLAHEGHCIVSEIDQERLVKGLPETVAIVDGMRYHFLGTQQRNLFLASMQRYGVEIPDFAARIAPIDDESAQSMSRLESPESRQAQASEDENPLRTESAKSGSSTGTISTEEKAEPRLAMGGFSPVAIHDAGQWVLGDAKYQVEFDEKVFFLAGEAEKNAFLEDPNQYVPVLCGDCVVSLVDEKQRIPGSVYFPVYYPSQAEGRLYLFAGAEQKEAFKANPERYANADLAQEGNCIVSLLEKGETVAGLPEHTAWSSGKRYFFASREFQERFLADPQRYTERNGTPSTAGESR